MKDIPSPDNRSPCPITVTLDLIGDRWTLVLVRDLVNGKSRYGEFLESPEGITTNILADRLKRMQAHGIVRRAPYHSAPVRYEYRLTERGEALLPILQAICDWANAEFPGTWTASDALMTRRVGDDRDPLK